MLFDSNGTFIDDINFYDLEREKEERNERKEKLKKDKKGPKQRQATVVEEDYKFMETRKQVVDGVEETITQAERMSLKRMSDDNKYFLFEDRIKREWRVYTIGNNKDQNVHDESNTYNKVAEIGL